MRSVTKTSKYVIHEESETSLIGSEMSLSSLEDAMDALDEDEEVEGSVLLELQVMLNDETGASGSFLGAPAGSSNFVKLFEFDFSDASSLVATPVSVGKYGADSSYQMAFHSARSFTLTVFHKSGDVAVYAGAKVTDDEEPSFLRKYGMMIFMLIFMVARPFISKLIAPAPASSSAAPTDAADRGVTELPDE